jgi:hypothetical protein
MASLTRVRIENLDTSEVIQASGSARVFFNPNQYALSKKVGWKETAGVGLDLPQLQFSRGETRVLALSLLFDSYEEKNDVRSLTRKVADLTEVATNKDRPPIIKVFWGPDQPRHVGLPFSGVVESLTQKFTLFLEDGTPVRATVDVSIREVESPEKQFKRTARKRKSPIQARSRAVKKGDSLWSIAAAEYDDPARWRPIAVANELRNPRDLQPGTTLLVPSVE